MNDLGAASELWFRPSPWCSLAELRGLLENQHISATPRLGIRDDRHPKGYAVGQETVLRLFDEDGREVLRTQVTISMLIMRRLADLTAQNLAGCGPAFRSWHDVRNALSHFERREVDNKEMVTIVRFAYRSGTPMGQPIFNSALELITAGTLRIASQPPENWRDLEAVPAYTIPLLAEDYPAKTAAMWNAAYAALGMPERNTMVVACPEDARRILEVLRRDPKYRGGGCGIGFKEVALPHLDMITSWARTIGAVNIIRKTPDGMLAGHNTDGTGYLVSLEEKFRERGQAIGGKRILILGAGGSSRAIAFALAERSALLTILNRTEEKARVLAATVNKYCHAPVAISGGLETIPTALRLADAVVSTIDDRHSPLDEYSTLGPMLQPVTAETITENRLETAARLASALPELIVSDIRGRKTETAMLRQARELGFATLDGVPMVVNQGIEAFWWLYGEELSRRGHTQEEVAAIMRRAAEAA